MRFEGSASSGLEDLLRDVAARAARYLRDLDKRRVAPDPAAVANLGELGGPVPENGSAPADILALLDEAGSPAAVASAGGRYFGFMTGTILPATLAANWMAVAWDQNSEYVEDAYIIPVRPDAQAALNALNGDSPYELRF